MVNYEENCFEKVQLNIDTSTIQPTFIHMPIWKKKMQKIIVQPHSWKSQFHNKEIVVAAHNNQLVQTNDNELYY